MKKIIFIFTVLFFVIAASSSFAQNDDMPAIKPYGIGNRGFEIGIANVDFGFGNNFIGFTDIFKETIVLDFTELKDLLSVGLGINVRPLYININSKDRWGFGLDIGNTTVYGNLDIAGKILQLKKTDGEEFGAGASVFTDVGIPVFFRVGKTEDKRLKISVRPAGYVPVAYTIPQMKYIFKDIETDGNHGSLLEIEFGAKIHTPVVFDQDTDMVSTFDISSALGFDISVGAEYRLFKWLDLGVNVTNIPLKPSTLNHYMELNDKISLDTSKINFIDMLDGGEFPEEAFYFPDDIKFINGEEPFKLNRPFRANAYANFRPFGSQLLTLIPMIGYSVNPIYVQKSAMEAGVKVRLDLANMLIATAGINYEDRMWKNTVDLAVNLRLFEIDLGIGIQSQDFAKSWTGAGLHAAVGLKFGW